jgi:hypothetical protein
MQANQEAHAIALPFNKSVSAYVRMCFTIATMIIRKEIN